MSDPVEQTEKEERQPQEGIMEETLKPFTKSKTDKEFQEWEVESTKDGSNIS
ncbi:hypothetical protein [Nitrososphaera sp.]|uniref:hypothetical protein n=1 Tax=Nitrososphaera sp. TaxID=1971748 RepID=UPI00307E4CC5